MYIPSVLVGSFAWSCCVSCSDHEDFGAHVLFCFGREPVSVHIATVLVSKDGFSSDPFAPPFFFHEFNPPITIRQINHGLTMEMKCTRPVALGVVIASRRCPFFPPSLVQSIASTAGNNLNYCCILG
jgi:hypothetical protein